VDSGDGSRAGDATRRDFTKKYARQYADAGKKRKAVMLDELVGVTGRSRAYARRAIATAAGRKGSARAVVGKPQERVYGTTC